MATAPDPAGRRRWPYDIIYGVHSAFVLWNLFMAIGGVLRALVPAASDWLGATGMMFTLGVWVPALLASPVVILASLWLWRDRRVLLLALLLGVYVVSLQYADERGVYVSAAVYTLVAVPLCWYWFFRKRRMQ